MALTILSLVFVCLAFYLTTFGWVKARSVSRIQPIPPEVAVNLQTTVRVLSHDIGKRSYRDYANLQKAAKYIEQSFLSLGFTPEDWTYTARSQQFSNIIVKIQSNSSKEYIVIGAHYDTVLTPGADDNATGVAGVLELARLLKGEKLSKNILLVAFVNEECPFSKTPDMGSRVFTEQMESRGMTTKAAIVLEMLGYYTDQWFSQRYFPLIGPFYPNQGNFIAVVSNIESKSLADFIYTEFESEQYFPIQSLVAPSFIPAIQRSDHSSFWLKNIPAVMITDTSYLRNKNYHQDTDTVETLNFDKMTKVVWGLKETIVKFVS